MSHDVYGRIDTGNGEYATAFEAGNYTSNCSPMWAAAISGTFDKPQTRLADLEGKTCAECAEILAFAIGHMDNDLNRARYEELNPENGWGSFESAREYLRKIFRECQKHPLAYLHVEAIEAWVVSEPNAVQPAVARRSTAAEIIETDGLRVPAVPKNGTDFQLEELQKIVGGSIEITHIPACCGERIMVLNEEGKILGLPLNAVATRMLGNRDDVIVGPVLVCPSEMVK